MNDDRLFYSLIVAIVIVLAAAAVAAICQPAFEAATFNKFRPEGAPQATYWDALWADLRVTSE